MEEFLEISAQGVMPHFRECWWDHIIQDIFMSNIPAIALGFWVQKKLDIQPFDFWGKKGKKSIFEWDLWHCPVIFFEFIQLNIFHIVFFYNGFFQMNNFLIPPVHPFPPLRMIGWLFFGSVAVIEANHVQENRRLKESKRKPFSTPIRWLVFMVLALEVLANWKYRFGTGRLNLEAETPAYVWIPWTATLVVFTGYWVYLRFIK